MAPRSATWTPVTSTKTSTLAPRSKPPIPAIRIGHSERAPNEMRFGRLLVGFMRVLALLWIAQGLLNWSLVLVGNDNGRAPLEAMPDLGVAAVVVFAVLDLIAAVGLWLAASWGGVVWLVAVAGQWLANILLPGFLPFDLLIGLVDTGLVAVYFLLTFRAAREIDL